MEEVVKNTVIEARKELLKNTSISVFFASTFWRKLQSIFGECCISKLAKVAKASAGSFPASHVAIADHI